MSSISIKELTSILKNYPDNYEVIMKISTNYDTKAGTSIAYINGYEVDDDFREIRLMN